MADEQVLDINTMQQYVLVGLDADGKYVSLASPNITLEQMGGYIGRLQAALDVQIMRVTLHSMQKTSKIVTPGNFQ